jgi:hypothetical protein
MDELDVGADGAAGERHPQRIEDEIGAHVAGELPADDAPGEDIDDEAEEHHALPAAQVGEVRDPQPIGPLGAEVALHEIGRTVGSGIGRGGAPRLAAALGALDGVGAHQALDPVTPDPFAGPVKRLPHSPIAVGVVVRRVQLADDAEQPLVLHGPNAAPPDSTLVVSGRRHVQDPADRLDAEAAAVLIDERAHFGRSASSSVAKNTDAAFRISFARRSS